jgi:hypothetical protein
MTRRRIGSLSKEQFLDACIEKATAINSNWQQDSCKVKTVTSRHIWMSAAEDQGFALRPIGTLFFKDALQITPYYIAAQHITSQKIVTLNNVMPWPYSIEHNAAVQNICIFSSEVAVWAALYGNSLDALLEAYSRK